MTVDELETYLGIVFPLRHRAALLDPTDPIHEATDFLVPSSPYESLDFAGVHRFLHHSEHNAWPSFLIAIASNGCGDYFAYDLRTSDYRVIYIDPDLSVTENLESEDRLEYPTFEVWYAAKVQRYRSKGVEKQQGGRKCVGLW